ncbi:MAG TPA: TIR domain-containing protein [Methyloceanibacter sp.]|jgi:hypothetical protein|nr:TIR domain-containing protein [Methyloceanibacter sp.]
MPYRNSLLGAFAPPVKRKAFFSFHFDDVMRVNNVRNAWKITHPDSASMRSFYDSSLWESKKLQGDDAVKRLIREGVCNTSAVCVLAGTNTWWRRWVRYEIACAIVDKRGLLTVHINGIKHHPKYYLFEKRAVMTLAGAQWSWERYQDYTDPVDLPRWLHDCQPGEVSILSGRASEYDYVAGDGHQNIGNWIDASAKAVGR